VGLFKVVRRVLLLQLLAILLIVVVMWALGGKGYTVSAMLGGMVGFLPNAVFAFLFGRNDVGKSANQVVRAFYVGEAIKLALTAVLFITVFQLPGIQALPLFIAFVAVMTVFWFSLLFGSYKSSE